MGIVELERKEILDRIKAENDLVHHRMTWLGSFQGFLFAAVAFAWKEISAQDILYLVAIVGLLTSISIGYAIHRANTALDALSAYWDTIKPKNFQGLDVEGVRSGSGIPWLMPGAFIPKVLACTWIVIILAALRR